MEQSIKIKRSETGKLTIVDQKIRGISFAAILRVNENSGLPENYYGGIWSMGAGIGVVDFSKINIIVRLKRSYEKMPTDLINARLDSLMCSVLTNSVLYENFRYGRGQVWQDDTCTEGIMQGELIFPTGIIDVQKDDVLTVSVQCTSSDWLVDAATNGYIGTPGQKLADPNNSYIRCAPITAHDHETQTVIPRCTEYNFAYNQDSTPFFVGDNVQKIDFYTERERRSSNSGNPVVVPYYYHNQTKFRQIDHASIYGTQFSRVMDDEDILRVHMMQHEDLGQASHHFGHYTLYDGDEIDNCKVTIRLRNEGVEESKEARVVVWRFDVSRKEFNKAAQKEREIQQYNTDKIRGKA